MMKEQRISDRRESPHTYCLEHSGLQVEIINLQKLVSKLEKTIASRTSMLVGATVTQIFALAGAALTMMLSQ